jgi:multicomponent Na+:H+ antiporter subunit A
VNPAFILSVITVLAGAGLYAVRVPLRSGLSRLAWSRGPAFLYERSLDGLNALARGQTRFLQSGYLRYYLLTILLATTGLAGFTLFTQGGLHWPSE